MQRILFALLFAALVPSIFAATGGWRFAQSGVDLGTIMISTNLTNDSVPVSVKPGDFYPDQGYNPAVSGGVSITLSGGNLANDVIIPFMPPAGYSTLMIGGSSSDVTHYIINDAVPTAVKVIGGSFNKAMIRLLNALNESVSLNFNGTGYDAFEIGAVAGGFAASNYQIVPAGDATGIFYAVATNGNVLLAEEAKILANETVYTAFLSESVDANGVSTIKLKIQIDEAITVSYVRAVHAVPDLKSKLSVDVLYELDSNTTVAANISYFYVSNFKPIEPGNHEVEMRPVTGEQTNFYFTFDNLSNYTVLVHGLANDTITEVIGDLLTSSNTSALVRIINLIPGLPAVQVSIQDSSNTSKIVKRNTTTPSEDASVYLTATGASTVKGALIGGKSASPLDYTFEKNSVYTIWVYGTSSKPSLFVSQDYPTPPSSKGLSNLELGLIIAGAIMFVILLLAIIIFAVRSRPAEGYERIEN